MKRLAEALTGMTLNDWLVEGGLVTMNVLLWAGFFVLVLP